MMAGFSRLLLLGGVLLVTGCGDDLTRTFGLTRDAPDEFQVTTRAPLSMPPDFNLRPPRPGADRPQELPLRAQAEGALVPEATLNDPAPGSQADLSPGQSALLQKAGPTPPPDIRKRVDAEAASDKPERHLTDRLMFWRSEPPPGTLLDAQGESRRLRQNAALGQSPETGDTPIIQQKSQGWFDSLF